MIRWALCAALALTASVPIAAIAQESKPQESKPQESKLTFPLAQPSWEGWSFSIQLLAAQASEPAVARPIAVQMTWKNLSTQTRALPYPSSLPGFASDIVLTLIDSQGKDVPPTHYGSRNMAKTYLFRSGGSQIFKPGEEIHSFFLLNRLFDLSESGRYFLTISHRAPLFFGPKSLLPPELRPRGIEPEDDGRFAMRIFKVPPIPNLKEQGETILVPALQGTDVPTISSNRLEIEISEAPTAWEFNRPLPAR